MRSALPSVAVIASVLILVIPVCASAQSADPAAPPAETPATNLSPMMQEITDLITAARAELADLEAAYLAASGSERNDLEKRIATLKIDTEIGVLETQIRHAAAAGRDDDVRRLSDSVAALRKIPRSHASPRPRAVPGAGR